MCWITEEARTEAREARENSKEKLTKRRRAAVVLFAAALVVLIGTNVARAQSADFSVVPAATAMSIVAGGSGSVQITVNPSSGFHGAVTFSCSGLPSSVPCTFMPNPVMITSTAMTTLMTVAPPPRMGPGGPYSHTVSLNETPGAHLTGLFAALFPLGIGGVMLARRRMRKSGALLLGLVLLPLAAIAISGCGYSKPKAATFPMTVTATSGALMHSVQVMVTIN